MQEFPTTKDAYRLIHNGILAFSKAEQAGIRVDVDYCQKKKDRLTKRITRAEEKLKKSDFVKDWKRRYGQKFNMNSDYQLEHMLYKVQGIEPPKKTRKEEKGATDEETLKQLNISDLNYMLEIRKLKKIRDTYLDAFLREAVNGYIHPFFNLHTTRTYRSSSNNPNFQNIPKHDEEAMNICRRALFPRPGHQLLEVDFGALEVSIAYCYHQDPIMYEYLTDPDSNNMHDDMARQIYMLDEYEDQIQQAGGIKKIPEFKTLRDATKNGFVFPQFYGDYYGNNANDLAHKWGQLPKDKWKKGQGIDMPDCKLSDHFIKHGIKSYDHFLEHMKEIEEDFWGRRFFHYQQWKDKWLEQYQEKGYFDMYTGFRCKGVMRKNEVINYPVQGSAFHCLLWSFIEVDRILEEEQFNTRLIGQIHDAMILDVHPDELEQVSRIIQRVTCVELPRNWTWITIPLEIEADLSPVDGSWNIKESYKLPEV